MGLEQGASTCQVAKFLMYLRPQHLCGTERCWQVQGHDGMGEVHQSQAWAAPKGKGWIPAGVSLTGQEGLQ